MQPAAEDLHTVGTVATVLQMLKLPDGTVKVLVEGRHRALVDRIEENEESFLASIRQVEKDEEDSTEAEAMRRA